jgi:cell shape-determining protein MreC
MYRQHVTNSQNEQQKLRERIAELEQSQNKVEEKHESPVSLPAS